MTMTEPITVSALLAGSLPTPAGPLAVVLQPDGTVRAAGFSPLDDLVVRLAAADVRRVGPDGLPSAVVEAVERYGDGEVGALDLVPVLQAGGGFYQDVWLAMRRVAPGTTVSYTELAAMAGRPAAVRAAGTACARNLVAPFVPCHRIVRTDGALGGYAYGLTTKRALLDHERHVVPVRAS